MTTHSPTEFITADLGRMPYAQALSIQRETHQQVVDGSAPQTLLLVEHDPVITISRRPNADQHLLADADQRAKLGIALETTDRGGDITYHGPGQLVAYPILRLGPLRLNVGRYMRLLEQSAIDTAAAFGISAQRIDKCTGVWVNHHDHDAPPAKLCALGIRVQKGVTLHGLALNVTTNLDHFQTIVPCGLAGRSVTSMQNILGEKTPTMDRVKSQFASSLRQQLEANTRTPQPNPQP